MIAVDPTTVAALRAHRAGQNRERLAWGPAYQDNDLVFSRENGTPLDPDSISGTFERMVRRLSLPRIRLHDLRHTHPRLPSPRESIARWFRSGSGTRRSP